MAKGIVTGSVPLSIALQLERLAEERETTISAIVAEALQLYLNQWSNVSARPKQIGRVVTVRSKDQK